MKSGFEYVYREAYGVLRDFACQELGRDLQEMPEPRVPVQDEKGQTDTVKKMKTMEDVRRAMENCQRCRLCGARCNIVLGDGPEDADIMVIGEGPGAEEDKQGLPFVGRAGQLLTKMLAAINLDRKRDVYITNIVKCRPPENRTPQPDEIQECFPFLEAQIEIIKPKIIVLLGAPSARTILATKEGISKIRGQWFEYMGTPTMPTFHPAYLLRNPNMKAPSWEDLKEIRRKYDELRGRK